MTFDLHATDVAEIVRTHPRSPARDGASSRNVFEHIKDLVYEPSAWQTAESLVRTGAYHANMALKKEDWYVWRSGISAPCYCDCRRLNAHPKSRMEITDSLTDAIRHSFPDVNLVVGMATAGISWARGVADNLNLPLAYVRASAKAHGVGGRLECSPSTGMKAVLVDDLVASGESILTAINILVDEGQIATVGVQTIVNWGFAGMRSRLSGVNVKALTSFPYILTHALAQGLLCDDSILELMAFYQDPTKHVWQVKT